MQERHRLELSLYSSYLDDIKKEDDTETRLFFVHSLMDEVFQLIGRQDPMKVHGEPYIGKSFKENRTAVVPLALNLIRQYPEYKECRDCWNSPNRRGRSLKFRNLIRHLIQDGLVVDAFTIEELDWIVQFYQRASSMRIDSYPNKDRMQWVFLLLSFHPGQLPEGYEPKFFFDIQNAQLYNPEFNSLWDFRRHLDGSEPCFHTTILKEQNKFLQTLEKVKATVFITHGKELSELLVLSQTIRALTALEGEKHKRLLSKLHNFREENVLGVRNTFCGRRNSNIPVEPGLGNFFFRAATYSLLHASSQAEADALRGLGGMAFESHQHCCIVPKVFDLVKIHYSRWGNFERSARARLNNWSDQELFCLHLLLQVDGLVSRSIQYEQFSVSLKFLCPVSGTEERKTAHKHGLTAKSQSGKTVHIRGLTTTKETFFEDLKALQALALANIDSDSDGVGVGKHVAEAQWGCLVAASIPNCLEKLKTPTLDEFLKYLDNNSIHDVLQLKVHIDELTAKEERAAARVAAGGEGSVSDDELAAESAEEDENAAERPLDEVVRSKTKVGMIKVGDVKHPVGAKVSKETRGGWVNGFLMDGPFPPNEENPKAISW